MAPVIEKRLQAHKENTNAASKQHSKKGLEILDFHESWLEEMEIYKDQMLGHHHQHHHQRQHQQLHHQQLQHQQLLLSAHNHLHTPQGCQFDTFSNNIASNGIANSYPNLLTGESSKVNKSRIFVRNSSAVPATTTAAGLTNALMSSTTTTDTKNNNAEQQLLLKRPREESTVGRSAGSTKRHARPISQLHAQSSPSTSQMRPQPLVLNAPKNSSTANTPAGSSSPNKQAAKIIVNKFHASSLLCSQHIDEKAKILTQNGLTKSAATAYETSIYASNYLPQDTALSLGSNILNNHSNGRSNEGTNYIGVSLAKNSGGINDSDHTKSVVQSRADDDPCAAIDDVNDYSDTDSEENYTGDPFYLLEDGEETHQSRTIRNDIEQSARPSEDSEGDRLEYFTPKSILSSSLFPNVPPYLNFSSHATKGPAMPAPLHKVLKWKLSPVMPKIVKRVVLNSGFRIIKNTTDWMAIWEKHMKSPGFRTIRSHQKYNHMPGSFRIGRKDSMWRSIYNNTKKFGSKEFGFMQRSYIMPDDLESLRQVWPKNASKLTKWIVKPPASARGTGIRIINKWSQFPKDRPLVVQKYIERPLLINDSKFDMRIYVVLTSINPLRLYMYKDGLARFASVKYSSELNSLDDRCMHLTNYSINKFSQNYSKNEDFNACQGHKWTLQSLWSCLEARGVNTKRLWATLRNLVIKAIISGESGLNRMYRQNVNFRYNCFELFGFDVLLDENLIPWLLEINISPSLHSELPLDLHVKGPLIQAVLNTALYQVPPKLNEKQQSEIMTELDVQGPLCHDKRIFTTCLTTEEVRKHNQFTNRSIEYREEYVDSILENLLPDDVRCLIIAEDEFARSKPLERIFPTPDTHMYLKFIDNPRYYNRLLDAWEYRYGQCREEGVALLSRLCEEEYHLQVSDAALEKEPDVTLTEIDMLHSKKSDDPLVYTVADSNSALASKAGSSPESNLESSAAALTTTCSTELNPGSKTKSSLLKAN